MKAQTELYLSSYVSSLDRALAQAPRDGALVVTGEPSTLDLHWAQATGRPVHRHPITAAAWLPRSQRATDAVQLSLSFFANDEDGLTGPKYRLLLEAAKLADEHGFTAIWSPERHFHSFGGLYPSPTATSAALAAATRRIGIRAGSVVMPLHDPIRVAEEWAVIDNLSGGRVGVSFASGWHADDFVLAPDRYAERRTTMAEDIDVVRRLWRGEAIERRNGNGDIVKVAIRPRPIQPELPFWYTAAGSPDTFRAAGHAGAFVLTNLMGQTLTDLASKVDVYRAAWGEAGHGPGEGHVTLMLHAFLAEDVESAHAQAREPLLSYFRSSVDITRGLIAAQGLDFWVEDLAPADLQTLLEHGVERYLSDGGLFGTADSCTPMIEQVRAIGVNEVAALIDFGVPVEAALRSVELLGAVARRETQRAQVAQAAATESIEHEVRALADWIRAHPVAAIQATPDTLAWLADLAPDALRDTALLTENGTGHEDILRRVARLGGYPMVEVELGTWLAARARYGPAGELVVQPSRDLHVVDDLGRRVGTGVVGRLAPAGEPVAEQRARWRTDGSLELMPTPPPRTAPLSFAQQRLWSLDQLMGGSVAYNNPVALRLLGPLDTAALHGALREVVRRHEVLRTTFPTTDAGTAIQLISQAVRVDLPITDASADDVERLAREHARLPFDLVTGPLVRARLLRLSNEEHVLLICLPHIVSDGWSAGVLLGELAAAYRGEALPALPMQYADYAQWQRREADFSADIEYWRDRLAGAPLLELPLDHPRAAVQTHDGARHPVRIDRKLADSLRALGNQCGATPFMVLQTAMAALLHRYSGQTDVVIGTSVAGRGRAQFEPLVGVFVNSVVIRTDASGDPTFRELLSRVKTTSLQAFQHQEVPFERLVDELKVPRDLSLTPLFQAMLILHNTPSPKVNLGDLSLEGLEFDPGFAKLDLLLELREDADGIAGAWEYNTDVFEPATIERLTAHLVALLSDAAMRPDIRLSGLTLMSVPERTALISISRGKPLAPIGFDNVATAFEAHPPATLAIGDNLTYAELDARANRIAHGLRASGVGPGSRVVLLLDRPEEAITAMLGVLKSGGAYVPLDPGTPKLRLEELVRQAEPTVVLSNVDTVTSGQPATRPEPAATGADPAYVIFTSGSTGQPKGVVVAHSQLLYSTQARIAYYEGPSGRCVAPYPLNFDASVGWIYYALLTGGTLWMPTVIDPHEIAALVERIRAERFSAVPALYGQVLEAAAPEQMACLRTVSVVGERCPPEVARRHLTTLPGVAFHNEYGPTEATVWCTSHPVIGPVRGEVSIGRPIPGALALVLDEHRNLLPQGAPGELYVGGPGVALGYLNQPQLTDERFAPNPSGEGTLYRTGDLVRWNNRAELEFLGRIDRQVKVRGFRVEPAEVEAAIAAYPQVAQATVTADRSTASTRLIGYAVARPGALLDPQAVTAFLRERLPDYLMPAEIIALDRIPRTPNGKIDVAALPKPGQAKETGYTAARTEVEHRLAAIVGEVLGGKAIGVHDDFFASGGDSLLAITTVTRARAAGIEINVRQLFQNPTVAGLAAVAATATAVRAEQGAISGPIPLSPPQAWFFNRDIPLRHHWNASLALELTEPVDPDRLRQAFRTVLRHHDALRQRFEYADGSWRQYCVPDEPDWTLSEIELADGSPSHLAQELEAFQASLDLGRGPMLRALLVHSGDDLPDRLMVCAHHLVIDGYSWWILLEDLFAAYRDLPLPPKTTSYREWSSRISSYAEQAQSEIEYWAGLPYHRAVPIPRDAEGTMRADNFAKIRVGLDPGETRALLLHDVHAALITALGSAMSRWTGSDYVHFDVQHHGRADLVDGLDLSRTVGWFAACHPVVLHIAPQADAAGRYAEVAQALRDMPHQGDGYEALLLSQPDSPLRDAPVADVTLNYHGVLDALLPDGAPVRLVDGPTGPLHAPQNPRSYALNVTAAVHDDQLWIQWTYAVSVLQRSTVEEVAADTLSALREIGRS